MTDGRSERLVLSDADAGLPVSRPPEGFAPVREWALASTAQLRTLRHELAGEIGAGSTVAPQDLEATPDKLVLIATELAANALTHGLPPTIVTLSGSEDQWLIDVADRDPESEPVYAGARITGAGGLGLHLARRLSLDVGWYSTERTKNIWATFSV
ncbi:ATP-binding protein [Cellulomonas dongxiuzhuiae]|uniref:ATP-binding protein n=1 Tax=Cellulomonas dongxiuzhuiae TaxID=2819979 RepID=A0ABX8GIS7_9CELL|nr:ATP-binding protein [Cellulomonas dongxiuzhuiae]MBO3089105.1 ATP-binding protein [Cellulomonas dongxiuzhuiae]MBO3095114.1 ATP-binding protein [Cellulomonas dongxiuzhuiae]QWC16122.1 ATP-binding protein [Cellulomonas dongxiuzhuiae]